MKKTSFKILLTIISLLLFSNQTGATIKDTVSVQLKWTHQFQFAGLYAAIENGYYKEAGLKVNIVEGGPNLNHFDKVLGNTSQFGIGSSNLLLARNNGMPVVVLATIFQHSPEIFISLSKHNIHTIEDFEGINIRLSKNRLPSTKAALIKEGKLGKVNIVESKDRLHGLINGEYKVIDGYSTDLPYALSKLGHHPVTISPLSYGVDLYGDCIFTSEQYLKKNPKKVKAFMDASIKGWQYAMHNKHKIAKLIREKYNQNIPAAQLMYEARKMEELILPNFVEIGHTNKARWHHIAETFVKLGWLNEDYSLDGFLYAEYEEARINKQNHLISAFSLIMALLIITLLASYIFNRRLRKEVTIQTKTIRTSNEHLQDEMKQREAIYTHLVETTNELESNQKHLKNNNTTLQERNQKIEQINHELKIAKLKAEESDRLKSAFLSNMSHEIRTPMNGIIGFSDLLKEHDISRDEKEKYTRIIEENSSQLLRIISDIIDISKIEIGEISIHKEPVDIRNIFDILYHNFALKTKELKGDSVKLAYDIEDSLDPVILTDPARLKQILSNLIENAIKFTSKGDIYYSIEKNTSHYIFTVRDSGTGIPKERVEKVFDRFFKDHDQHFSEMGGTGLGLSIAKNMVELLDGEISLKSKINEGTEFQFTHPL